jgi:cation diffusion facilitator family transporter
MQDLRDKVSLVRKGAWVGIVGNFFIASIKLAMGIFLHSMAVIADAIHTFEDLLSSITLLVGYRWVLKPPDKEHPYGHGRAEELTGMAMAFILLFVAIQIGWRSFKRIIHPSSLTVSTIFLIILLLTALLKELMARYSFYLAKKTGSSPLRADGVHHRTDALSSLLIVGGLIGVNLGVYVLDGILGLLLSLVIAWLAFQWFKRIASSLLGEAPSKDVLRVIEEVIREVDEAEEVHRIRVHNYGFHNEITLHLHLDPRITLEEAHRVATKVERIIKERIGGEITVHIEPKGDKLERDP